MLSRISHDFSPGLLHVGGKQLAIVDLPALFDEQLPRLPVVLRLLLENVVRHQSGDERRDAVAALLAWIGTGTSNAEIAFQPGRVLMHDTTSTPALVDIAAMRDALAEAGRDPSVLNPMLPVDVSVDHSLAVEVYAKRDAAAENLAHEMRRNAERYRFLRWASKALRGVRIHPPGTGIMHTINLEQLATVVTRREHDGASWAVPDTLIGTDSHTPMINGIGVLGWGVGGLEAQTVMFGMPVMLRIPDVVGVRLTGVLPAGVMATDLALAVTQQLRAINVAGDFVEFFGTGVAALGAGERAIVANMAPEYGATTGYFPIDERTLDYLRDTGRDDRAIRLVREYAQRVGLWFDPTNEPRYTRIVDIDLSTLNAGVAGPRRPQDRLPLSGMPRALAAEKFEPSAADCEMPRHPVAIAAIASCTNTSDPALLIAAGLLARNARRAGLRVPAWVKTSLSPGSPAAADYLERAGLRDHLAALGFDIVGFGCATCIGNSGPLPLRVREAMTNGRVRPVAVLSGNRNFPGRVHPDLDLGFLMSPPLVIACALAGDAERDLTREPIGTDVSGRPAYLSELWPSREEIAAHLKRFVDCSDYARAFDAASANPAWRDFAAPESALFPWNPDSNVLRRPPFASAAGSSQLGRYIAWPLLVLGDDVTTDHISPAGAIPTDSFVADYLVARGEDHHDLNVFASRRGNWEVMLRGAFHNKSLINALNPEARVAHTLHVPSGEVLPIWRAAQRYREDGDSVVLIAGERYGTGSSRDWAAKAQRLLGIRAVLAKSFERIHRSNLIGMGILPLQLAGGDIAPIRAGDRIEIDTDAATLAPRCPVPVRILHRDGRVESLTATAAIETRLEVTQLCAGGILPLILRQHLAETLS